MNDRWYQECGSCGRQWLYADGDESCPFCGSKDTEPVQFDPPSEDPHGTP